MSESSREQLELAEGPFMELMAEISCNLNNTMGKLKGNFDLIAILKSSNTKKSAEKKALFKNLLVATVQRLDANIASMQKHEHVSEVREMLDIEKEIRKKLTLFEQLTEEEIEIGNMEIQEKTRVATSEIALLITRFQKTPGFTRYMGMVTKKYPDASHPRKKESHYEI